MRPVIAVDINRTGNNSRTLLVNLLLEEHVYDLSKQSQFLNILIYVFIKSMLCALYETSSCVCVVGITFFVVAIHIANMCIFYMADKVSVCKYHHYTVAATHFCGSQNVKFICMQFIEYNEILLDGIIWNEWRLWRVKRPTHQSGISVPHFFFFCNIFDVVLLLLCCCLTSSFFQDPMPFDGAFETINIRKQPNHYRIFFVCRCCCVRFVDCTSNFHTENVTLHGNCCIHTNTVAS